MNGEPDKSPLEDRQGQACQVVSDAGPIIALSAIGQLDLLRKLFGVVCIPAAVYHEIVVQGEGQPGSRETHEATWISATEARERLAVLLLRDELGAGESEAIVLAQELNAHYLLLDDAAARRKAQRLGIRIIGTLGVLLMARSANLIPAVKPLLNELRQTDFRMSATVYREVLQKAGEARDAAAETDTQGVA
jgi:predicted nucleic acid-binding protein